MLEDGRPILTMIETPVRFSTAEAVEIPEYATQFVSMSGMPRTYSTADASDSTSFRTLVMVRVAGSRAKAIEPITAKTMDKNFFMLFFSRRRSEERRVGK